jgi:hypothetical protein
MLITTRLWYAQLPKEAPMKAEQKGGTTYDEQ